jgi:Zn-dependent oligopeptidase
VQTVYAIFQSTMNGPDFQKVETEMEPKLAAHMDKIVQNEKLARVKAVYEKRRVEPDAEQKRLVWLDYTNLVHAGAQLDAKGENGSPRSTSASRASSRASTRTSWPTSRSTCSSSRRRQTSRGFRTASRAPPRTPRNPAGRKASGRS